MSTVAMPRLSDSMEEGTILHWLVADGETVRRGQELAEIETDKASMVYEADAEGTLQILAREGETLPVGAPIAELLGEGETPSSLGAGDGGSATNGAGSANRAGATDGAEAADLDAGPPREVDPVAAAQLAEERVPVAATPLPSGASAPVAGTDAARDRVKASPLARRLAAEASFDVAAITGTGPGGRVVKADVESAIAAASAAGNGGAAPPRGDTAGTPSVPVSAAGGSAPLGAKGSAELVELTRTQELIARRMAEAKATIPEFTLDCEIDMEAVVQLREQLKALAERRTVTAPSYNDLVVKACALALRQHPKANGSYRDGRFELHARMNVGVAVAADDALVVPVIRDADALSVWEIAAEARRLAAAVRDGSVTPPELSGGTFSVSNLGMFGVDSFTAVINPPQAAILAVGSLKQRAVVRAGELEVGHTMHVTLSCDHRILYGADAARFLATVRELLEQPLALLA
jgi:pyruvate dehydrogenase E2 component (dihydrolipoamide acetyltransferase)